MADRLYTAAIDAVTIAAVQDIFMLKAGAANGTVIHQIRVSAGGVTSPAELRLRLKRLPATVTNGSGGTTPTINFVDTGDSKAATATLRANDTTQATTSGTAQILAGEQWNVLAPFEELPIPELRWRQAAGEAFVLDVAGTVASTVISGRIIWEEIP